MVLIHLHVPWQTNLLNKKLQVIVFSLGLFIFYIFKSDKSKSSLQRSKPIILAKLYKKLS